MPDPASMPAGEKDLHQQHPRATAKMSQGHWEQCREWGERESEDEPAPKKGANSPCIPDQLVAV